MGDGPVEQGDTSPGFDLPTGSTRLAAVIGSPVRHSRSPAIHNAAYRALGLDRLFVAFEVPEGGAPEALDAVRTLGIDALSVTMPHKEAVCEHVDSLEDDAAILGAVNCVINDEGTLRGHNTDGEGFLRSLAQEARFEPNGKRCVVLGAGGAARAVVLALARAGAATIGVVNRTPERAERAVEVARSVARVVGPDAATEADLVVNATPAGMPGHHELGIDPSLLGDRHQVVVDLVYEPLETPLLAAARSRGHVAVGGLGMLVHQAVVQIELLTGSTPSADALRAAAEGSGPGAVTR